MIDDLIARAPKVLLHDHLDGGLRASSVIELAAEYGYRGLPTNDVAELSAWFNRGAKRNDLVLYLETFAHTVGVMQHKDAIERVAYECAQDLAADGVVYAEVRMAPGTVSRGRTDVAGSARRDPRRLRSWFGWNRPHDLRHLLGDAYRSDEPRDRRVGRGQP